MDGAVSTSIESITAELLAHLRAQLGTDELCFAEPPARIAGGFEALTLRIRLGGPVPAELAGELIARVLPEPGGIEQALVESTFQNAVAAAGFPAPTVVVAGGARTVAGRAFNLMTRVSGRSMMEGLPRGRDSVERAAGELARAHAQLHEIATAGVEASLESAGISAATVGVHGLLLLARRYAAEETLGHLGECADWLVRNRPPDSGRPSLCHGDFHPGNVMVEGGEVSGVLDWSGPRIAHAEYDVATTLLLLAVAGPELAGGIPRDTLATFAKAYVDGYGQRRAVDADRLRYYRALRAFRAFARGSAAWSPCADPALLPREHYPWADRGALRTLARLLRETTGLVVPLPRGAER